MKKRILDKEVLTNNLINREAIKKTRQLIPVYLKIRNNNLYFSTPPKRDNHFRDLVSINPDDLTINIFDLKMYLKTVFSPALVNDNDLREIKSYLTHLTGDYTRTREAIIGKRIDPITTRLINEELKEKKNLLNYYEIKGEV